MGTIVIEQVVAAEPQRVWAAWTDLIRYSPPRRASTTYAVSGRWGHHQAARPSAVVQAAHTR